MFNREMELQVTVRGEVKDMMNMHASIVTSLIFEDKKRKCKHETHYEFDDNANLVGITEIVTGPKRIVKKVNKESKRMFEEHMGYAL